MNEQNPAADYPGVGYAGWALKVLWCLGLALAGLRPALDLYLITVLLGLVILVIAAVCDTGTRLQHEQDFTVWTELLCR